MLSYYAELVAGLGDFAYTKEQMVEEFQKNPSYVEQDFRELVQTLLQLRLLQPLEGDVYRRWQHLNDSKTDDIVRYAALTLLVPDPNRPSEYTLPVLDAPFDMRPHPAYEWPYHDLLLPWYEEAGLVQHLGNHIWRSMSDALADSRDPNPSPTIRVLNVFLAYVRDARAKREEALALEDDTLPLLDRNTLNECILEIQRELLIDASTILRIYRSLVAGQHVILSGPPGTGKTHLARLLPKILWRQGDQQTVYVFPRSPNVSPATAPTQETQSTQGYLANVVTATEDWGIRHVIGGIVPRVEVTSHGRGLTYSMSHGCLTRAVLSNYGGYQGNTPPRGTLQRHLLVRENTIYRGQWLVIDEFTRAPIDAAFGSLLTTLGGQHSPLMVPMEDGNEVAVPFPRDFRIIATLNSFDRHFLNQMSEAMKRRFTFIDVLPPTTEQQDSEHLSALRGALERLEKNNFTAVRIGGEPPVYRCENIITLQFDIELDDGNTSYLKSNVSPEMDRAIVSCKQLFQVIRIYRKLGTAQITSLYTNLLSGVLIEMGWEEAFDTALADTLVDQLQVLSRDEQQVLVAYVEHVANGDTPPSVEDFTTRIKHILRNMPAPRQTAHLAQLRNAEVQDSTIPSIEKENDPDDLLPAQIGQIFPMQPLSMLPAHGGLFLKRLRTFVSERGL